MKDTTKLAWDDYFLNIVTAVGLRAGCGRGKSGCVITKDNRILTTGYVGAAPNMPDCFNVGHLYHKIIHQDGSITQHCIRTIHAEQNAITQAAQMGIAIKGATLYCTMVPCFTCAKLIVVSGIIRVVCLHTYQDSSNSQDLFKQTQIELKVVNNTPPNYN